MGRNIVVCCDGTANQFDQNNTNVVKLYSALVDDARCYHGVTPVEPENPALPAYRDVLVVTFRKKLA